MSAQSTNFLPTIILISLIFFVIAIGLVLLVAIYNQKRRLHIKEKQVLNQQFEAEILKVRIEVQEQTLQKIAAELHDNIGQLLSLTTLTLSSIDIDEPKKAAKKIADSLSFVRESIKGLRDLVKLIHGEQILQLGLGQAIQQELLKIKKTGNYKLKIKNELSKLTILSPNKDLIILRLFQEIINNIIKHAQAKNIEFEISLNSNVLKMIINENGIGFDYEKEKSQKTGMGLKSINERIASLGGEIKISSSAVAGTHILIQIPYP